MSSDNTTNSRLPFILLDAFQLVTNNFGDLRLTCMIRRILDQFHAWYCLSNDTKFPTNRYNWYRHEVHEVKCLETLYYGIVDGGNPGKMMILCRTHQLISAFDLVAFHYHLVCEWFCGMTFPWYVWSSRICVSHIHKYHQYYAYGPSYTLEYFSIQIVVRSMKKE